MERKMQKNNIATSFNRDYIESVLEEFIDGELEDLIKATYFDGLWQVSKETKKTVEEFLYKDSPSEIKQNIISYINIKDKIDSRSIFSRGFLSSTKAQSYLDTYLKRVIEDYFSKKGWTLKVIDNARKKVLNDLQKKGNKEDYDKGLWESVKNQWKYNNFLLN